MKRIASADKYFDVIMNLDGEDDLKALAKRLRKFQQNCEKFSVTGVTLPNYLWVAKRGVGITTRLGVLSDYLYAAKLFEFTGNIKFFEFKLSYTPPDDTFSELTRLDNVIMEIAGHHRYFRGIACIDISEWMTHTDDIHFHSLLDYLRMKGEKLLAVYCVYTANKRMIESVESALSSRMRLETIVLKFPPGEKLVMIIEEKYVAQHGFSFSEDAKKLLAGSIKEITTGKNFNGYITIRKLANDILYSVLASNLNGKVITAKMLSGFDKDSDYISRIKDVPPVKNVIGFSRMEGEGV